MLDEVIVLRFHFFCQRLPRYVILHPYRLPFNSFGAITMSIVDHGVTLVRSVAGKVLVKFMWSSSLSTTFRVGTEGTLTM